MPNVYESTFVSRVSVSETLPICSQSVLLKLVTSIISFNNLNVKLTTDTILTLQPTIKATA